MEEKIEQLPINPVNMVGEPRAHRQLKLLGNMAASKSIEFIDISVSDFCRRGNKEGITCPGEL